MPGRLIWNGNEFVEEPASPQGWSFANPEEEERLAALRRLAPSAKERYRTARKAAQPQSNLEYRLGLSDEPVKSGPPVPFLGEGAGPGAFEQALQESQNPPADISKVGGWDEIPGDLKSLVPPGLEGSEAAQVEVDPMEDLKTRNASLDALSLGATDKVPRIPEKEPWQLSAEAETRISDLERQQALVDSLNRIGTGFGQMAAGDTGIEAPDTSGPVDEALAQAKDILPEAERAWLNQKFSLGLPAGVTRTALQTMLPTLGRLQAGDVSARALEQKKEMDLLRLSGTNERFGERMNLQKAQLATKVGTDFDKMPLVKLQKEALTSADKALQQLATGSQIGEMGALISLARTAGEKGPLSDTDVGRWAQRRGWLQKLEFWANQAATGHFTEQHRSEMKQLLEELRDVSQNAIKVEADRFAKRYSTKPGVYGSYDDVMKVLLPEQGSAQGGAPSSTAPAKKIKVRDAKGNEFMLPESQIQEAEKQGYTRA